MAATTQPGDSATAGPQTNLWEEILNEVGSSKATLDRNVLILGDPHSGKSTLIAQLKQAAAMAFNPSGDVSAHTKAVGPDDDDDSEDDNGEDSDAKANGATRLVDLALGYTYIDVKDEEQDDVARLGVYQLAEHHTTYRALLKYALNRDAIAEMCVVIVLDWSQPWRFVQSLLQWIDVLEGAVQRIRDTDHDDVFSDTDDNGEAGKKEGWTRGKVVTDECRERLERLLQEYTEPSAETAAAASTTTTTTSTVGAATTTTASVAAAHSVLLPLGPGTLTDNLGIPLVVVCSKADTLGSLERQRDFKEDHFDFVQQTLRTVCLKYGAALFYTSLQRPETYMWLYRYLLHRLTQPVETPGQLTATATGGDGDDVDDDIEGEATPAAKADTAPAAIPPPPPRTYKRFAFPYRAHVVERDLVMVPAGWDSWAKIQILREGYDCRGMCEGWDHDRQAQSDAHHAPIRGAGKGGDENDMETSDESALAMYAEVVPDPADSSHGLDISSTVVAEDDQAFLESQYRILQQTASQETTTRPVHAASTLSTVSDAQDRDPNTAVAALGSAADSSNLFASATSIGGGGGGGNGHNDSAGSSLTASGEDVASKLARLAKLRESVGGSGTATGGSAASSGAATAAGGSNQTAIVANFFQSLLAKKSPAAASSGGSGATSPLTATETSPRSTASSTTDVTAELERMRNQFQANKRNPS